MLSRTGNKFWETIAIFVNNFLLPTFFTRLYIQLSLSLKEVEQAVWKLPHTTIKLDANSLQSTVSYEA